jgi:hypothetical protein
MKRNFTFDEKKRNYISLFLFRKTSKISQNFFLFRIVACFAKKGSEMETLAAGRKIQEAVILTGSTEAGGR